jgi:hypothetical protein
MLRMATRVLRILVVALTVTGCSSVELTPSAEVQTSPASPAASPTAEATVIAEPSQIVEPTADAGLAPDDVAQVVTTDLVVRSAPGTGTDSEIYGPTLLSEPQLLYVVDGPVFASGYDWYLVAPFVVDWQPNNLPPPGWVAAASRDGEVWIAPAGPPECGEPMLRDIVVELSRMARLACYGDTPLTLEGTFGGCFQAGGVELSPSWLGAQGCLLYHTGHPEGVQIPDPGGLIMRFQGEIGVPYDQGGVAIRVDGHFDDPAALTCVSTEPEPSLSPELIVFGCRTQFVATQVSIIGQ